MTRKIQKEKETEGTEENSGCTRYLQGCCASPSMMEQNDDDDDLEKEIFNPNTEFGGVHANEYIENVMDVITENSNQSPNEFSFETLKTFNQDEESNINETLQVNNLNKTNTVSCCTLHVSRNCNDVEDKRKRSSSNPSMRNCKSRTILEFSKDCAQQPLVKEKSLSSTCTKSVCKATPADMHVKGKKSITLISNGNK